MRLELEKSSIWKKIRLAYALNYRMKFPTSIVYKVRNGKGFFLKESWIILLLQGEIKQFSPHQQFR